MRQAKAAVVQHVTLEVRREQGEEVAAFWELLGFARVDPPPSLADRAAWLQHGATQVHLMWVEDPTVLPRGHVAVVLEDWEDGLQRLRAAGHEPEPRTEHWGSPRAYVHDPAGNLVELMAFMPGSSEA
jgi:catechol 2,3-dioxygenase-like lactoylglutathione lyase family enzyme